MSLRGSLGALALLLGCATADARSNKHAAPPPEDPFAAIEIVATHVAGNVYMLEGGGGNIAVSVGDDGVLIVDDQFAQLAPKIKRAIAALRSDTDEGPLKFVLNTHWHGDHSGGNQVFGAEAVIVAHDNVRMRMKDGVRVGDQEIPPSPKVAWPVVTFDRSLSLHFNGERIHVVYLASGHTDGDVMVLFEGSKVVHMGDDFVTYGFPFVDLVSGGNVLGLTAAVGQALALIPEDYRVIPGHGKISTLEDMRGFQRMLVDTTDTVRGHKESGATLAEAQAAGVGAQWKDWAGDFVDEAAWIELIWTSLERHHPAHEQEP